MRAIVPSIYANTHTNRRDLTHIKAHNGRALHSNKRQIKLVSIKINVEIRNYTNKWSLEFETHTHTSALIHKVTLLSV